jgi:hypothetical protein
MSWASGAGWARKSIGSREVPSFSQTIADTEPAPMCRAVEITAGSCPVTLVFRAFGIAREQRACGGISMRNV